MLSRELLLEAVCARTIESALELNPQYDEQIQTGGSQALYLHRWRLLVVFAYRTLPPELWKCSGRLHPQETRSAS